MCIATVTIGRTLGEFKVLAQSVRSVLPATPLVVLCDAVNYPSVMSAIGDHPAHVRSVSSHEIGRMRAKFTHQRTDTHRWTSETLAFKQQAMMEALELHPKVLFLDADCMVLDSIDDINWDAPASFAEHVPGHHTHGRWQGGVGAVTSHAFAKRWQDSFFVSSATGFFDQAVLQSDSVLDQQIVPLPKGYAFGPWYMTEPKCRSKEPMVRQWQLDDRRWPSVAEAICHDNGLSVKGSKILWNGISLKVAHCHMDPASSLREDFSWRYWEDCRWALLWLCQKAHPDWELVGP